MRSIIAIASAIAAISVPSRAQTLETLEMQYEQMCLSAKGPVVALCTIMQMQIATKRQERVKGDALSNFQQESSVEVPDALESGASDEPTGFAASPGFPKPITRGSIELGISEEYSHKNSRVANDCVNTTVGADRIIAVNHCGFTVVVSSCPMGAGPSHCNTAKDDWSVYAATIPNGESAWFPSGGLGNTPFMACRGPGGAVRATITSRTKGQCLSITDR